MTSINAKSPEGFIAVFEIPTLQQQMFDSAILTFGEVLAVSFTCTHLRNAFLSHWNWKLFILKRGLYKQALRLSKHDFNSSSIRIKMREQEVAIGAIYDVLATHPGTAYSTHWKTCLFIDYLKKKTFLDSREIPFILQCLKELDYKRSDRNVIAADLFTRLKEDHGIEMAHHVAVSMISQDAPHVQTIGKIIRQDAAIKLAQSDPSRAIEIAQIIPDDTYSMVIGRIALQRAKQTDENAINAARTIAREITEPFESEWTLLNIELSDYQKGNNHALQTAREIANRSFLKEAMSHEIARTIRMKSEEIAKIAVEKAKELDECSIDEARAMTAEISDPEVLAHTLFAIELLDYKKGNERALQTAHEMAKRSQTMQKCMFKKLALYRATKDDPDAIRDALEFDPSARDEIALAQAQKPRADAFSSALAIAAPTAQIILTRFEREKSFSSLQASYKMALLATKSERRLALMQMADLCDSDYLPKDTPNIFQTVIGLILDSRIETDNRKFDLAPLDDDTIDHLDKRRRVKG